MAYECMTLCLSHSPGFARDDEEQFGSEFRSGVHRVRDAVAEFAPTVVVMFGSDHRRTFVDTVPAISVVLGAEGLGDLRSPTGPYDVPRALGESLAEHLLAQDFDASVTRQGALDHGFGLTAVDVLGGLDVIPILPVFINCATPPLAPPRRAAELGSRVGDFMSGLDERVLYIGSGGMSHSPPTLALTAEGLSEEERRELSARHREAAKDKINPEFDQSIFDRLAQRDWTSTSEVTQAEVDLGGVGANEVRTWLAAHAAGDQALYRVVYEPVREWLTGMGIALSERSATRMSGAA